MGFSCPYTSGNKEVSALGDLEVLGYDPLGGRPTVEQHHSFCVILAVCRVLKPRSPERSLACIRVRCVVGVWGYFDT